MGFGNVHKTIKSPHDGCCAFETPNLWTLHADQSWLDWLEKSMHCILSPPLFQNFFLAFFYIDCNGKEVLNSSCSGVLFLLRMINEGSWPQKAEVFFLIRQAMLIKLLKCSLITGSPLIPTFFWGFTCVWLCVCACYVSTDVISSVFLGGGIRSSPFSSPTVH